MSPRGAGLKKTRAERREIILRVLEGATAYRVAKEEGLASQTVYQYIEETLADYEAEGEFWDRVRELASTRP